MAARTPAAQCLGTPPTPWDGAHRIGVSPSLSSPVPIPPTTTLSGIRPVPCCHPPTPASLSTQMPVWPARRDVCASPFICSAPPPTRLHPPLCFAVTPPTGMMDLDDFLGDSPDSRTWESDQSTAKAFGDASPSPPLMNGHHPLTVQHRLISSSYEVPSPPLLLSVPPLLLPAYPSQSRPRWPMSGPVHLPPPHIISNPSPAMATKPVPWAVR